MASPQVPADAKLAFVTACVLAGSASAIGVGAIGWMVAPLCILLGWYAIIRAPLRSTMLVLMFLALVLENPSEQPGAGQWSTPFVWVGALMLAHFKFTIGFGPIGGMDLALMGAIVAYVLQRKSLLRGVPTPRPMIRLAQANYATIAFTLAVGILLRGGQMQWAVWQMDRVMYLPTVFLLCQAAFSGPNDYQAVGKVALFASLIRATQAMWVRLVVDSTVDPETGESSLPYATTHNDSMLFAVGSVILVALVLQRTGKKGNRLAMLGLPVLIGGMLANHRRMVWVEIILVFFTVYMISEVNAFKRKLNKAMIFSLPVLLGYVAVGWNSAGTGIFKPVKVIRSAVDSSSDTSTAWRDLENFNLVFTMRNFPLTGVGYGNGFWEMWPMPAVDYSLERYVPHDSILGLYCYGGYVGYLGITSLWVAGIYFAIRAYHRCREPTQKAAALASFGAILVYYLQCFGDMGLGSWTGVWLVGPALVVSSKLTVAAGAWELDEPARRAARRGVGGAQAAPGVGSQAPS